MRQWRVGSFSMGLVLVLLGVALIVFRLNRLEALNLILAWWPLVLVLLGGEILLAGFLAGGERPRLKHDWFAVLAVVLVLLGSAAWQAVNYSGVRPALERAFRSTEYTVDLPEQRVSVDESVSRLVVEGAGGNVEVRSSTGSEVVIFGQARLSALSQDEARDLARQAAASSRREGDTIFLSLAEVPLPRDFGRVHAEERLTLLIPSRLALEMASPRRIGSLNLVLRELAADWSVKTSGPLSLTLGSGLDARVQAEVPYEQALQGNLPWQLPEKQQRDSGISSSDGPVTAKATLGGGRFLLRVESGMPLEAHAE